MKIRAILAVWCLWSVSCTALAEQTIICPENILQEGGTVSRDSIPAGFAAMAVTRRIWLSDVSLYYGHPEKNAVLKPVEEKDNTASWDLGRYFPEGKWMSCDYGLQSAKLHLRLQDAVIVCTATYGGSWEKRDQEINVVCR